RRGSSRRRRSRNARPSEREIQGREKRRSIYGSRTRAPNWKAWVIRLHHSASPLALLVRAGTFSPVFFEVFLRSPSARAASGTPSREQHLNTFAAFSARRCLGARQALPIPPGSRYY